MAPNMEKIQDSVGRTTGRLTYCVCRRGVIIEEWGGHNLVVTVSKGIQARLLGAAGNASPVTQFGVGTNSQAEVVGNTALTAPFLKAFDSVSYPADNQVTFAFSLAVGDANGIAISEFGLLTGSGLLFARKARATPINKASDITLSGSWTINF